MTEHEKYQEHIQHTHDVFCKTVIRHAAIDAARSMRLLSQRILTGNTFTIILFTTPLRWTAPGNSVIFYCPGLLCNG